MDLRSSTPKQFLSMLDECHADIRQIARLHPEVIDQLETQYNMDLTLYGKLPVYLCIQTNEGLINTSIRYSEFLRFLPVWKKRPDIIDSTMVANIIRPMNIPLLHDSQRAVELYGDLPSPNKKR